MLARPSAVAVLGLALMAPAVAQTLPLLPDLKFAEIGAHDKYLGDRWSYMEAGRAAAPPIVLLHGVGANSMHWRYQFAGLSDTFRVVAWNAPGYMLSDAFKAEWPTCQDYSDALSDFLAGVKLDRVNIVGNSFGSRVAQCFAIHQPSRVIKLAMTGTGIGPKGMSEEEKTKIIATREGQIAKGGYGFGARVKCASGQERFGANHQPRPRGGARNEPSRLHARGQTRHGGRLRSGDGGSQSDCAGADDIWQRRPRESDCHERGNPRQGDAEGQA